MYHFHLTDGRMLLDPRGVDLPFDEAAICIAISYMPTS
jgi:hypothetical protein